MAARRPRRRAPLVLLAVVLGLSACALLGNPRPDVAPHQWWDERGPVVPHDSFPKDCSACHLSSGWNAIRDDFLFDHEAETGVALAGAHATAECLRCHNDRGPVALFADKGCAGCHEDVHRGQLGKNCHDCHGELDWQPQGQIAQHDRTRFPLVGAHAATACWACHEGAQVGNFSREDVECISCHREDLARATSPDHLAQGWVDDCDRCHTPIAWEGAGFAHDSFPLIGGHGAIDCEACHVGGVFSPLTTDCGTCHLDDYQATTSPPHLATGFSTECAQCHTVFGWEGATFDHTGFPLIGGHAAVACADCHPGGLYIGTPTDCFSCHADDYQGTTDPNHSLSGFSTNCEQCHSVTSWDDAAFDHTFPIQGGDHGGFDCLTCHQNPGNFAAVTCTDCHEHSQRETDDEHDDVGGYVYQSSACISCHPTGDAD